MRRTLGSLYSPTIAGQCSQTRHWPAPRAHNRRGDEVAPPRVSCDRLTRPPPDANESCHSRWAEAFFSPRCCLKSTQQTGHQVPSAARKIQARYNFYTTNQSLDKSPAVVGTMSRPADGGSEPLTWRGRDTATHRLQQPRIPNQKAISAAAVGRVAPLRNWTEDDLRSGQRVKIHPIERRWQPSKDIGRFRQPPRPLHDNYN